MTGTFTNKTLTAGPSTLGIKVNLSGSPAALQMWNAQIKVAVGPTSKPATSTGGPPGHMTSEHVLASLTSFESGGVGGSGVPTGELCGNITAQSLSKVTTPALLVAGGMLPCDEGYAANSKLLDVLVGGCTISTVPVIAKSQPDKTLSTNTFTAVGGGATVPPYILSSSGSANPAHSVDTCTDSSSTAKPVVLSTCLSGLGYSSAFTFQTDRVIIKP
jgi:hypothetical protein